jgi:hypothetical protein
MTECDDGEVESRQIMMEEELSFHQEEGEVVEEPTRDGGTDGEIVVSPGRYKLEPS